MSIFVPGVTRCSHCERTIAENEPVTGFTVFVSNEKDPLYRFNDAVFHTSCLGQDPYGRAAVARHREVHARLGPPSHRCVVCSQAIDDWRDNVTFPHLTEDRQNPLFKFNYAQVHRTCLARWKDLSTALALLRSLERSGAWQGATLGKLIENLEAGLRG